MPRLEDLPADLQRSVRAAVRAGAVTRAPARKESATRRGSCPPGPRSGRWRCERCDAPPFTAYAAAERHVDETHGHGRIAFELKLEERA